MYTGNRYLNMSEQEMADFYEREIVNGESFVENEYGMIFFNDECTDVFRYSNGKYCRLDENLCIANKFSSPKKIYPRNKEQTCAIDLLLRPEIPVKVLSGVFGSGKDYLMVNAALYLIELGVYEKIVYVRNNIEVKDTTSLGSLPGDEQMKILPFVMPLVDHLGGMEGFEHFMNSGQIEPIHLGYIRGRDLQNSIILCSEAENLTVKHVQLLLGRVGKNSALWLNGDHKQTDKKIFEDSSGLKVIAEKLRGNPLFGAVHLPKSERSEVARLADLLD